MSPLSIAFAGAWLLLGVGFYGLMIARNLLRIVIALQLMLKAALVSLVVAGALTGQLALGQSLAITVIVADTLAAVIGLALTVQIKRQFGTLELEQIMHTEG